MKTTEELYEFLNSYQLAVVSTVNPEGLPSAAIIGFGQTKELELIFGTDNTTRKYKNLSHDKHVAFAIGGETPETIQYEGIARELDQSELDIVRDNYWNKNPHAAARSKIPTQRYFIVKPTWLRYTDIRTTPWDITERTF